MVNKGTGAGGVNTTVLGKAFEILTNFEPHLLNLGFIKYKQYLYKEYTDRTMYYFVQSGFKTFVKKYYDVQTIRIPDEACIIEYKDGLRTIKILEKKEQRVEGSVELKLWAGPAIKREYELIFPGFKIEYAFCLSNFFRDRNQTQRYTCLDEIFRENDIQIFYGTDDKYVDQIKTWIGVENDAMIKSIVPSTEIVPILKWPNDKTTMLPVILNKFPRTIQNYHEPFLGGASVLIGLLQCIQSQDIQIHGSIHASDANRPLVYFYKNVQRCPHSVIEKLENLLEVEDTKEYYYQLRNQYNGLTEDQKCTPEGSALFLYLNKTGNRAMIKAGSVPYGKYKNPEICNKEHIMKLSNLIQPVQFYVQQFTDALNTAVKDDFVYLNLPQEIQQNLSETVHNLTFQGIRVIINEQMVEY